MTQDLTAMMPMMVNGVRRMIPMTYSGGPKDFAMRESETARVDVVEQCRLAYHGDQFEEENAVVAANAAQTGLTSIPEHLRKHAYSTMIRECVDFIIGRIGSGFALEALDPRVQEIIEAMVQNNEPIMGVEEDGDYALVIDDVLREAAVASDLAVKIGWDDVEQAPLLEFWESERVSFQMKTANVPERVVRTEVIWGTDDQNVEREIVERRVYELRANLDGFSECVEEVWWDAEDKPRSVSWMGVGAIPWTLFRVSTNGLREYRGASLITPQIRDAAKRFDAVEQTGYLIARYNSHSNVAVIGDNALLRIEQDGRVHKDVADVLTFPGGTALQVLTLPTDPQMIDHQREVLTNSIYNAFGLNRVDQQSIEGLGGVSGYALEILNQKTEVTFSKIGRRVRMDWVRFIDLLCDVVAWKRDAVQGWREADGTFHVVSETEPIDVMAIPPDATWVSRWFEVDPQAAFPNRKVKITLGTGYIVDDVAVRDDFVAGLISQEEALRKRGYDPDQITKILGEQKEKADAEAAKTQAENSLFQQGTGIRLPGQPVVQTGSETGASSVGSTVAGGSARQNGAA